LYICSKTDLMSELKDRIKHIIDSENLTYSKFADIIGVQRSGISHILSGRNNPSLEVIQKILEAFNFINTDWLLFGKGEMVKEIIQGKLFQEDKHSDETIEEPTENINPISVENLKIESPVVQAINSGEDKSIKKEIERIVIFYKNKSFGEYLGEA
jgi:transcriptional regulator with XRE-family HTH domain